MNAQQMGEVQSLSAAEQRLQNEVTSLLEIANRHNELSEDSNFLFGAFQHSCNVIPFGGFMNKGYKVYI